MRNSIAGWISLTMGIAGASLLSFDSDFRNYGFFMLAVGCIATMKMMYHPNILNRDNSIFIQSAVFMLINLNGIYQFFIAG